MPPIKILCANKKNITTEAVEYLIRNEKDFERIGRAEDIHDLLEMSTEVEPDVLVLCAEFEGDNTASFISQYLENHPHTNVILMAQTNPVSYVIEMLNAGVKGYIDFRTSLLTELSLAIRTVADSRFYICQSVQDMINFESLKTRKKYLSADLGSREIEVLKLLASGSSSKEIAIKLSIATSTVEVHRRNIMQKLDMHNIADLTRYAIRQKLITA